MTRWAAFAGLTLLVLSALLVLSRLSQDRATRPPALPASDEASRGQSTPTPGRGTDQGMSTDLLLLNVALSQGLFGAVLVFGAVATGVPAAALGLPASALSLAGVATGVALGVALYVGNETATTVARLTGFDPDETLRGALAPTSGRGWVVLLTLVLPLIAAFEELLFRAALVGALSAGYGTSPWLLAGLSSVAFALGHGAQGRLGMVVTGLLGFGLAAAFVLTGSLVVVVVAHYVVNALEFVVHEGPVERPTPGS